MHSRTLLVAFPAMLALSACGPKFPDAETVKSDVIKFFASARPGAHYQFGALDKLKCSELKDGNGVGCGFLLSVTDEDAKLSATSNSYLSYAPDGSISRETKDAWPFEQQIAAERLFREDPRLSDIKIRQVDPMCDRGSNDPEMHCGLFISVNAGGDKTVQIYLSSSLVMERGHWTVVPKFDVTLMGGWESATSGALHFHEDKINYGNTVLDWKLVNTGDDGKSGVVQMQRRAEGYMTGTITKPAGPVFSCDFKITFLKLTLSNCGYPGFNSDYYRLGS